MPMAKIIEVDKDTQIKIICHNYLLQRKIKNRKNRIAWHTEGYHPDLMSLSLEYLNTAPYRAIKATERFEKLIEVIKSAEEKIINSINKLNLKK